LVWTGSEYGLSWYDNRDVSGEIYFTHLSADSIKQAPGDVRVSHFLSAAFYSSLVWTGTGYGVAWEDWRDSDEEIYFVGLDANGTRQFANDLRISNAVGTSRGPSLVWNPVNAEYGLGWEDWRIDPTPFSGNSEIYFNRISSGGVKIGVNDTRCTNAVSFSEYPSMVWANARYGIAWTDMRGAGSALYFKTISSTGATIKDDTIISAHTSASDACLAWTGIEYGVTWFDDSGTPGVWGLLFRRIDANGNPLGSEIIIATNSGPGSGTPRLVWNGNNNEYGVAWAGSVSSNMEICFARINASGAQIGSNIRITNDPGSSLSPSLVWTGTEYGVAWFDSRNGNNEIYFARLAPDGTKK
jgi:hypothetical protein